MRFGIVGTNFVSDYFMAALREVPGAAAAAVSSRSAGKAEAFAAKYGIPKAYSDYRELDGEVDAVYLPVPNSIHAPLARWFLERRIPVLSEKPFTSNLAEAKELFRIADEQGTYIADGIVPLYAPNFRILKKALADIAPLRRADLVFAKYSSRYDAYLAGQDPPTFRAALSNGALMDLGIYPLAVAIGLFGRPAQLTARGVCLASGVDGAGTVILEYPGFQSVISYSKITDTAQSSEIAGEQGLLEIEQASRLSRIWLNRRGGAGRTLISGDQGDAMAYEIRDFMEVVSAGRRESALVPHQLTLEIMEAATEARRQMGVRYPADQL